MLLLDLVLLDGNPIFAGIATPLTGGKMLLYGV